MSTIAAHVHLIHKFHVYGVCARCSHHIRVFGIVLEWHCAHLEQPIWHGHTTIGADDGNDDDDDGACLVSSAPQRSFIYMAECVLWCATQHGQAWLSSGCLLCMCAHVCCVWTGPFSGFSLKMKNNNNNIIIIVFHGRYYVRALLVLGTIIITITADITVYFNILFSLCLSYSFCLYAFGMDDTKTAKNKEEKIKHRAIISKEPVYLHVQYSRVRLVLYFFFYISAPRHIDPKISTEVASSTFIKLMMSKTHRQTHNRLATHIKSNGNTYLCSDKRHKQRIKSLI